MTVGEVKRGDNGDSFITWGWLAKAIAGMVIVGIPSSIAFQVSIVTTQTRIETRQMMVLEQLAAMHVWKTSVDERFAFYRGPLDVQWAAVVSHVEALDTRLSVLESRVDFLRGPRDTAWQRVERSALSK